MEDLSDVKHVDAIDPRAARQIALLVKLAVDSYDEVQAKEIAKFGRATTDDPAALIFAGLVGRLIAVCASDPEAGLMLGAASARVRDLRQEAVESRRTWERMTPAQRAEVTS